MRWTATTAGWRRRACAWPKAAARCCAPGDGWSAWAWPTPTRSRSASAARCYIRAQDHAAFERLVPVADRLVGALAQRHGFEAVPTGRREPEALRAYLAAEGKDILHLGGGLPPAKDPTRAVLRPDLSFPRATNVTSVSTASLARASVVNPTHTLLAMAEAVGGLD
jgi:choline dehydrogenase-like flavoprotein